MAAASAEELHSFVSKFAYLWHSGKSARFSVECEAGEATIHLQLRLGVHLSQPQQNQGLHQPTARKAGPSRLRRRARRAQARASAAEQVVGPSKEPHNEAEEAIDEVTKAKSDEAVQAAEVSTVKAAVAAQAADIPPTRARADAAVQVALHVPPLPAAQAGHPPIVPPLYQDVLDMFCPDNQYLASKCLNPEERRLEKETRDNQRKKEHQEDLDKLTRMIRKL